MVDIANLKSPTGRLREHGARRIIELRRQGQTYQEIAATLSVSISTVYNVCKGRTWAFLNQIESPHE